MSEPISIAIIAGQLVVGGAERQLYLWLSNLDRERFDPIVLTLHPGHADYWEEPIEALGIPLFRIAQRRNRLRRLWDIIRVLRPHRPQLIHGWHLFASAYAGLAARVLGARCLGGVRNTYETFTSHRMESWITLHTADALVANSKQTASALAHKQQRQKPAVFAVQNAIEDQFASRESARAALMEIYHLPADALWLVSMGRLEPLKRFDWLLELMSNLKKEENKLHLVLIGDGPERQRLSEMAGDLNLEDCVTMTGEVPMASTWLKGFDIFVFPSVDEGMPNVIMEAGAAGQPILTWRLPFYEELLTDGQNALLVEPGTLTAMEEAIRVMSKDEQMRNQLGQAAREHILAAFSLERFIREMTGVYEQVLGGQK